MGEKILLSPNKLAQNENSFVGGALALRETEASSS